MTELRKRMLEELQRRRYSPETIRLYLSAVQQFAKYFGKRPDHLGPEHLRQYQLYLLNERKLSVGSVIARTSSLRFFFLKVLRRPYREVDLVPAKCPKCDTMHEVYGHRIESVTVEKADPRSYRPNMTCGS